MNEQYRRMLIAIAQQPRKSSYFTHDRDMNINPEVLQRWLYALVELGYAGEKDGVYKITAYGRKALDKCEVVSAAKNNVFGRGLYVVGDGDCYTTFYRPGSDHSYIKSVGDSC